MLNPVKAFVQDDRGDMAEKAVVMVAIILISLLAWKFLGSQIANLVTQIGQSLAGY